MLNHSNIRKGNIISNSNGNRYEVLATKKVNRYGTQDLLVRDVKYGTVVVAKGWDPDNHRNEKYGSWNRGIYFDSLDSKRLASVMKKFKSNKF